MVSCYLPMSSQKAQTGRTDFVVEHQNLYALTLQLARGENRRALLHHPPLVSVVLCRLIDLFKFNSHRSEESQCMEVWTLRQIWGIRFKLEFNFNLTKSKKIFCIIYKTLNWTVTNPLSSWLPFWTLVLWDPEWTLAVERGWSYRNKLNF